MSRKIKLKLRNLIFLQFLILSSTISLSKTTPRTPSGLYQDDGKGHTILQQKFNRRDILEMSYDLLNIMGFHRRPHPNLVDERSPTSKFLHEVYSSITKESRFELDVDLSNGEHGRRQDWIGSREKQKYRDGGKASPITPGAVNLTWIEFNVDQADIDAISRADEIISFVNRGHRFSNRLKQYSEDKQFWFDVSEISPYDEVYGAELRLWKKAMLKELDGAVGSEKEIRVSVIQVTPGDDDSSFEEIELDEVTSSTWEQGWLRLNVTLAFRHWIKRPSQNFGLIISTKDSENGIELPLSKTGFASILDIEEHQPFLVSFLKTSDLTRMERKSKQSSQTPFHPHPTRVSRSTNTPPGVGPWKRKRKTKAKRGRQYDFTDLLDRPKSCQMGMLYVNFEDLGWKDWVIAPDGFIAYYCHGECAFPLTASMNATNHAIVTTLVHTYYPVEYPKPACAPVKLGSISMLYYDDNSNVTVKKYKDMVTKSCGCK